VSRRSWFRLRRTVSEGWLSGDSMNPYGVLGGKTRSLEAARTMPPRRTRRLGECHQSAYGARPEALICTGAFTWVS
jgi:hypothetical protein